MIEPDNTSFKTIPLADIKRASPYADPKLTHESTLLSYLITYVLFDYTDE
ncbi:MAG: hypothetical protein ABIN94_20520 [Ferruginibacter sp.]